MSNLDSIDIQILTKLKQNARMKASQISDEVGLSVSSVTERIRKLEKSGVITSYTVLVDQKAIGNDTIALMEVSLEHPKYYDSFAELIAQTKNSKCTIEVALHTKKRKQLVRQSSSQEQKDLL